MNTEHPDFVTRLEDIYEKVSKIETNTAVMCANLTNHLESDEQSFKRLEHAFSDFRNREFDPVKKMVEEHRDKINLFMAAIAAIVLFFEIFKNWIFEKLGLK